jgi:hypothetical protein
VSRLHTALIVIAGVALVASLSVWWKTMRELQVAQRELAVTTMANEFLKKTPGEMTIAINAKQREIDRLEGTVCNGQKARPGVGAGPAPSKVSKSGSETQ